MRKNFYRSFGAALAFAIFPIVAQGASPRQIHFGPRFAPNPVVRNFGLDAPAYVITYDNDAWYVGGAFTKAGVNFAGNFIELNLSGAPATTCNWQDRFNSRITAVATTTTDIYVGGLFTQYAGQPALRLAKIRKSDCSLDTAFNLPATAGFDYDVNALAISGSSIYVGGSFSGYRGVANSSICLAKLDLTSGALDTTFSPPGLGLNGTDSAVAALAVDGTSLYIGGSFIQYRGVANSAFRIAKLSLANGDIDTTFSPVGSGANGFNASVYALKVAGGALYAGGAFTVYKGVANSANYIAKLNLSSGAIDTSFSPVGASANGFNGSVLALDSDGTSLFAGGSFSAYKGGAGSVTNIAKLDAATGALDTTFSPAAPAPNGFNGAVGAVALSGSSVYAGGAFTAHRGVTSSANYIAKLSASSGALDTSFLSASGAINGFSGSSTAALLIDGTRLYVGGNFSAYGGFQANRIAKFSMASGALDTTFSPQGGAANGFDSTVFDIHVSGDALIVGGSFSLYRNAPITRPAQLDRNTGALRP